METTNKIEEQNSTTQNNRLIAEFMGYEENEKGQFYIPDWGRDEDYLLRFHTNWNWLMPVVKRVLELCDELDDIERYYYVIDQIPQIDNTYKAVVEFIKWYNKELNS